MEDLYPGPHWEVAAHDDAELNDVISEELGALTARYLGVVNKGSIRTFQISANNKIDIGLLDLGKQNGCHCNEKEEK